jgi:signal transduction histidine kinase
MVSVTLSLTIHKSAAQTALFDSLVSYTDTLVGVNRIIELQEAAKIFIETSLDKGLYFAEESEKIINDIGNDSLLALNHNIIGNMYQSSGLDLQAENQYKTALEIYENLNDNNGKATETHNLGIIYMDRLDTIRAIDYFKQSLDARFETGNNRRIGDGLTTLGEVYKYFGDYESGIYWLSRALEYYTINTFYHRKFECCSYLADCYFSIDPEKSMRWIDEMEKMVMTDSSGLASYSKLVSFMTGQYYLKTGNYLESARIFSEIGDSLVNIPDEYQPFQTLRELSARLYEEGEINKALEFSITARNSKKYFEDERIKSTISEFKARLDFISTEEEIRRTDELNQLVLKRIRTESLLKYLMYTILLSLTTVITILLINYFKLKNDQVALSNRNIDLSDANKKSIAYKESILKFRDNKSMFFNILTDKLLMPFTDLTARLTDLSEEAKKSFNKEKFLSDLQEIHSLAISIEKSLKRILIWSKIQRKKYELNPELLNINDFLHELLHEILAMAVRQNIKVSFDTDPELKIMFDRKSLRNIIKIFIENSIDNSPRNSEIIIRGIKASKGGIISVTDFGKGIDPLIQDNIFEVREANIKKGESNYRKLGLGLLMAKNLAELNNSHISFETKKNRGTSFYLHIKQDNGRKNTKL